MSDEHPEILLARRLIERRGIRPPIYVEDIAREYADVEELRLPFDFDGISLFLKDQRRRPRIVLNLNRSSRRMRFTLAHELGHVLIPWHVGTIVDQADLETTEFNDRYATLEAQANRFASELLMPTDWVSEIVAEYSDPVAIVDHVYDTARVSYAAAAIKVIQCLPPGHMYIQAADDGEVMSAGRSPHTIASPPRRGRKVNPEELFRRIGSVALVDAAVGKYYWWRLEETATFAASQSDQEWRELLDEIVEEISIPETVGVKAFKRSLNGVIAHANSLVRGADRDLESVYSACLQRLHSKQELAEFCGHQHFDEFVRKRVEALLGEKRN